jgi:hypothetical protein
MNQFRLSKLFFVVVLFALVACQPQATPPAPTAIPPTTVSPTTTPTAASVAGETSFSSKGYKLHMSVSFGPDWHIADDYTDLVTVQATKADWNVGFNIVTNATVADPVTGARNPFPEDFASWIKSDKDFKAGTPTDVTVAGIKGLQIDATPVSTSKKDFLYNSANQWNIVPRPEGWRFILLNDVNGERLLILIIAPADEFKVAVEQAQPILDSVVFSK